MLPDHLRALIVILAIASVTFAIAKAPAQAMMSQGEFQRRRNLWFAITLVAFVSHNFWLFAVAAGIALLLASRSDPNPIGLALFVLLAVPPIRAEIPGFGGIRYLFALDYLRLIAIAVLIPAFLVEKAKVPWRHFMNEAADYFLIGYVFLNVCLSYLASSWTDATRLAFLMFLDVLLPYLVASRVLTSMEAVRSAIAGYVVGACVLAGVGAFEMSWQWLLYNTLDDALGVTWNYGSYLRREDVLRAIGSAGHSIAFGYAMAVGFCLLLGLRQFFPSRALWLAALGVLGVGVASSYSRGPWLGTAVGIIVFMITAPGKARVAARFLVAGLLLVPLLVLSPLLDKLLYAVTVESGNYTYRQLVLQVSIKVIMANPFFGAYEYVYMPAMEELRQGQGIIDIVNTYVAVALRSGLVGLSLFAGFFLSACWIVRRRLRAIEEKEGAEYEVGRALLATLACIMVTIFTVSSITIIPIIYYLVAGLAVGYGRLGQRVQDSSATRRAGNSPRSSPAPRIAPAS